MRDEHFEVTVVGLHDAVQWWNPLHWLRDEIIPFPETVIDDKTYFHAISNANYRICVKPLGSFSTGIFPLDIFRVELWLDGKLVAYVGYDKDKHMNKSTGEFNVFYFNGFLCDGKT